MARGAKLLLVSAAALIDAEGRVLVQRRPDRGEHGGLWEFPGGKLEKDEGPAEALGRELYEELGIAVDSADLLPTCFASQAWSERHLLLLLFVCRQWRGVPAALHASDLRWLFPSELYSLAMPPADLPLIGLLETFLSAPPSPAAGLQPDR